MMRYYYFLNNTMNFDKDSINTFIE
jgi:acetylornithine deacetylase/succinyl-diaminopimelate desuccinylase-like protein